ncbi:hypothetical protein HNP82_000608 [Catenibacillus scindens]|uniref:YkgJ family cysteine cluster protein n=1 Tax=Catenibacillus scindens TaxID=673271 RepID=A0A7W8H999_9FIRM|nr:YkgJ family cysteine cluster protein [Catenibacillus scindens]MBB5263510.1 hypothetical protein [Catenibacillus scindens]
MKRNVSLDEISDGKLLGPEDMARMGTGDCGGCCACCQGMGTSAILDPMDIFRLCQGLKTTFEQLLAEKIELNVVDGLILPNLKMVSQTDACGFLGDDKRCQIHPFRPGVCRLFPLGRYYEDHSFRYFLQIHECKKENRTKIKVKKWMDMPDLKKYDQYICDWHYFLMDLEKLIQNRQDLMKKTDMFILELFFLTPWHLNQNFYAQFYQRLDTGRRWLENISG